MLTFLNLLIIYDFILLKVIVLVFSLILLKFAIVFLIKDIYPNGYEPLDIFKIRNFKLNYLFVFIYIFFFILLLFALRIYRVGFNLDLKPFYHFILFFIYQKEFIIIIIISLTIFNLIIIFITIIKYLKLVLQLYLLRQHLYLSYNHNNAFVRKFLPFYYSRGYTNTYKLCIYIFKNIDFYTWKRYIIYNSIYVKNKLPAFATKIAIILEAFINIFRHPYAIYFFLSLCLLYDIIFNNGIIRIIYYILPFYFMYNIWYNLSLFLAGYHMEMLNYIVFELYYKSPEILYNNLKEFDQIIIALYIRNGLRLPEDFYWKHGDRILPIYLNNRYVLVDKTNNIYYNEHTKKYINIK